MISKEKVRVKVILQRATSSIIKVEDSNPKNGQLITKSPEDTAAALENLSILNYRYLVGIKLSILKMDLFCGIPLLAIMMHITEYCLCIARDNWPHALVFRSTITLEVVETRMKNRLLLIFCAIALLWRRPDFGRLDRHALAFDTLGREVIFTEFLRLFFRTSATSKSPLLTTSIP
ncbi:hypothetical protein FF38_06952 [Lucilia cuprina]|uniref:Uncharacterized protein n=1 Tax=Lucilia cuprina TaxID=7375 RepID=A0A0L0BQY7_LUCCU|nr:hypothetical protein FF38_06952 [Lucilia cuprina]